MPNPLDFLLKDPNAMRYELMLDQANLKKGGEVKGKAMGGTLTQPNPVPTQQRTPPGGAMRNISWAQYREAIGLKQGGAQNYAGGGKVYSGQLPDSPSVDKAEEPKTERSWLDTLGGLGETGLSLLTGMLAQPAAGIAGAAGETLGFGKGEDIAGRVAQGLTYAPTTVAGQQMQQDLMDFMVKTGVASLPPVVSGINPAALRVMPGTGRYVGQQAVEVARPLHEAYMAGEVPGVPAPASYVVKPSDELAKMRALLRSGEEKNAKFLAGEDIPPTEKRLQALLDKVRHIDELGTGEDLPSVIESPRSDFVTGYHVAQDLEAPLKEGLLTNRSVGDSNLQGFAPEHVGGAYFWSHPEVARFQRQRGFELVDDIGQHEFPVFKMKLNEGKHKFLPDEDAGNVDWKKSYTGGSFATKEPISFSDLEAIYSGDPEATKEMIRKLFSVNKMNFTEGGSVKKPTIAFPQNMNYNVDDMRHALARR